MSQSHGSNADIIGNGFILSEFLNSANFSGSRDASESTTFKKKSKTYVPGLKDSTMNAEGVFEGQVDLVDDILWAALGVGNGIFSYFPEGQEAFGRRAYSMDVIESSYEVNTDVGDVAQISAELAAGDKGRFERGTVLHPFGMEAVGGTSQSRDDGALTTKGASLVVHVVSSNNLSVKLEDSADGIIFAALPGQLDFTLGRASKRIVIPGNVRRHVRVSWTGSGNFLAVVNRLF
jgi:hypothetical protein